MVLNIYIKKALPLLNKKQLGDFAVTIPLDSNNAGTHEQEIKRWFLVTMITVLHTEVYLLLHASHQTFPPFISQTI